jgi:hypothetical protein
MQGLSIKARKCTSLQTFQPDLLSMVLSRIVSRNFVPILKLKLAVINTRSSVLYQQKHGPSNNDVHLDYNKRTLGRTSQGNTILQYKDRLENAASVNTDSMLWDSHEVHTLT